jgi:hypothetical protein
MGRMCRIQSDVYVCLARLCVCVRVCACVRVPAGNDGSHNALVLAHVREGAVVFEVLPVRGLEQVRQSA